MPHSIHTAPTLVPPAYDPHAAHTAMLRAEYDRASVKALTSVTLDGTKVACIAFGYWADADDLQLVGVLTTDGEFRDDLNATDAAACEEILIETSAADRAGGNY